MTLLADYRRLAEAFNDPEPERVAGGFVSPQWSSWEQRQAERHVTRADPAEYREQAELLAAWDALIQDANALVQRVAARKVAVEQQLREASTEERSFLRGGGVLRRRPDLRQINDLRAKLAAVKEQLAAAKDQDRKVRREHREMIGGQRQESTAENTSGRVVRPKDGNKPYAYNTGTRIVDGKAISG